MKAIPEAGLARLMFFIEQRLVQLRWSQEDLAAAGGPSSSTLRKARRGGRELAGRTLARLELTLGWQPGSGQQILAGGNPVMRLFDEVGAVSARVDATLAEGEEAGVRHIAAELRDFLMGVAQQLDGFYTGQQRALQGIGDASAC